MQAGKDVFCEKPLTNTITEGRQIVDAVEKTKSVFQTGSMQRSWNRFRKAKDLVQQGAMGKIEKIWFLLPVKRYGRSPTYDFFRATQSE